MCRKPSERCRTFRRSKALTRKGIDGSSTPPGYTRTDQLLEVSKDALLISGTFGSDLSQVFMASARFGGATGQESLLNRIIAISAIVDIPTSGGIESVAESNG